MNNMFNISMETNKKESYVSNEPLETDGIHDTSVYPEFNSLTMNGSMESFMTSCLSSTDNDNENEKSVDDRNHIIQILKDILTQTDFSCNDDTLLKCLTQLKETIDPMIKICENKSQMQQLTPSLTPSEEINNEELYTELSDEMYNKITYDHNVQIFPTIGYLKTFLKNIIVSIRKICREKQPKVIDLDEMIKNILEGLPKMIEKDNFYNYVAEYLIAKSSMHYYYDTMAAHIVMKRIHAITSSSILETAIFLRENVDKNGTKMPIISNEIYNIIKKNHEKLQSAIDYDRDFLFDFFGIKTQERSYLYKLHYTKFKIIERPQHMWMRVALGIHGSDIESAIETYNFLSLKYFTHATPTLFNSGTRNAQMSSCFLQSMSDDICSIFEAIKDIAFTSKWAGGIGVHISSLRSRGSLIRGTNGMASGIIPLCILLNKLAKYINQGGKRNGSIACLTENTEIMTINHGIKKIQNVKVGDLVMTHRNRIRPVVQVHRNSIANRKIYKMKIEKNKDIYVTGNHKFWSSHDKSKKKILGWNSVEELKEIMENKNIPCYVSIPYVNCQVNTHDYQIDVMDYKNILPDIVKNSETHVTFANEFIKRTWFLTVDFAYMLGLWIADGCIVNGVVIRSANESKPCSIKFRIPKGSDYLVQFIKKVCNDTFGIDICINTENTEIQIESHIVSSIIMELFGNQVKLPEMIYRWPKNLINGFFAGLFTGKSKVSVSKCEATIILSNGKIINELYHLSRNNGILCSIDEEKRSISIRLTKEIIHDHEEFLLSNEKIVKCHKKLKKINNMQDNYKLKILSITETDRNDSYVYTLGVEEDHSYTVEGVLVENCYLEPHHPDIFDFCDLRKNTGNDDNRARDLFLGLWISSLFIERVKKDEIWSLMCPDQAPGLNLVHGDEFNKLYCEYEKMGKFVRQVKARDLWKHILETQSETGFPYMLYKDNANAKSNQKNLGTIRSSNLCAEIIQYSDENETAVCFTADTDIVTKNGIKKIIDCNNEEILSYYDNDLNLKHYEHFEKANLINIGMKTIYLIKTDGNQPIKATEDHPFLIYDTLTKTKKWKKVSELKQDDMINTPSIDSIKGFDINISNNLNDYWLKRGFMIDLSDNDIIRTDIYNKNNSTSSTMASFLSGIFSFNGLIICDYGSKEKLSIKLLSVNKDPLYYVQSQLIPFGIKSRISECGSYLWINEQKYLERFMKTIGFKKCPKKETEYFKNEDNTIKNNTNEFQDYSKVISIQKIDNEYVYDLVLPRSHNFIANGYVVHNCNLASICLPKYVAVNHDKSKYFDHVQLIKVVRVIVRNLDKIIDRNYYPTIKTKRSNFRHRPMGIGVQGLADVYNIMGFGFDSNEAIRLNKEIFETIYFAAISESMELAKKYGRYSTFDGSPASQGQLQFHMWGKKPEDLLMGYPWSDLIKNVMDHGLRNSLLTAVMPTASTSQIMGNSECIEPYMSNIFKRSTLAGEFIVVNKNLMKDLLELNVWNDDMRKRLIIENGSLQNIEIIPKSIKNIYKTAFEIKQMHLVRQSADRGCFIDQSQSFNLFMPEPNFDILTSALIEAHDLGSKTGMYYYRSQPAVNPISFGIDVNDIQRLTGKSGVIDMISDSYNITDSNEIIESTTTQILKKNITMSEVSASKKQLINQYCKWKPGIKTEDCLSCGS